MEPFEDEVIDRLFVLNAKRAEEENLKGLAGGGAKQKGAGKGKTGPGRKKKDLAQGEGGGQMNLI